MNRFIEDLRSKPPQERREILMRRFRIRVKSIHKSVFGAQAKHRKEIPACHWSQDIENVPYEERELPIQWL
jgi:hypothetical protein